MKKYRYSTDACFMTREFLYKGKRCVGVSCFFGFEIYSRENGEVFFEVEDDLDPWKHENMMPELIKRITKLHSGKGVIVDSNQCKVAYEIDSIEYMEKVNYDHKIDTLIIYPDSYYVDTIVRPDEEDRKMLTELGLPLNSMLEPIEISKDEFFKILQDKELFESNNILADDSNTAYGWIEVKD